MKKILRSENEWIERFTGMGAFWFHDGNPSRPHALLTSGNHSHGFFDGSKVIEDPKILAQAMYDLYIKIQNQGGDINNTANPWVIGSALGAIDLSFQLGQLLDCRRGFTEPVIGEDGKKTMKLKRFDILPGSNALVVEDVFTTGETTRQTITALEEKGIVIWPIIGVLVNRSGENCLNGRQVVALIDRPMPIWSAEDCPLCRQGSEAIRPKANWTQLTAQY